MLKLSKRATELESIEISGHAGPTSLPINHLTDNYIYLGGQPYRVDKNLNNKEFLYVDNERASRINVPYHRGLENYDNFEWRNNN